MALIQCKECYKTYSDKAVICPECSCPTSYNLETEEYPTEIIEETCLEEATGKEKDRSVGCIELPIKNEKESSPKIEKYDDVNSDFRETNFDAAYQEVSLFGFKGRMGRSEFWKIYIPFMFLAAVFLTYSKSEYIYFGFGMNVFLLIAYILILVGMLPLMIRRMHDTNGSGGLLLLSLIPVAGFYILYRFLQRGDDMANDYGSPRPIKKYTPAQINIIAISLMVFTLIFGIIIYNDINSVTISENGKYIKAITFETGDSYNGEWQDGYMSGKGTYTTTEGDIFTGTWINNELDGEAIIKYSNGNKYEGIITAGQFNGQGSYTYANGTVYSGVWAEGVIEGTAIITFTNGDWYVGETNDMALDGEGVYTFATGEVLSGTFENNEFIDY